MRKLVNHLLKTKQRTENDSVSNDNKTESASTERPPETHYYLFELGFSVVKQEGIYWYGRDRKNHKWNRNMDWMGRFYDVGYDVVEIDYDEERESITGIRPVYEFGYPYDWLKEALDDKSYEMPSASTIKP